MEKCVASTVSQSKAYVNPSPFLSSIPKIQHLWSNLLLSHARSITSLFSLAGVEWASSWALQGTFAILGVMYPLWHYKVARKSRPSLRYSFDPLDVNPLAMVIVEDDVAPLEMVVEDEPNAAVVEVNNAVEAVAMVVGDESVAAVVEDINNVEDDLLKE
ncbi:hypothetical protein AMTR_s00063p00174640 [Amborella trichopoda]|uniref:Uncharacterized protein n=1 Tax=Amborella trichopoda TaxID=13333 RepID=U5D4C1_AMBTC|nr:hypothetical protein AMTR_s00063p00174640 [Amborella trichopoda]